MNEVNRVNIVIFDPKYALTKKKKTKPLFVTYTVHNRKVILLCVAQLIRKFSNNNVHTQLLLKCPFLLNNKYICVTTINSVTNASRSFIHLQKPIYPSQGHRNSVYKEHTLDCTPVHRTHTHTLT